MSQAVANIDFLSSIPSEVLQDSGPHGRIYDLQLQFQRAQARLEQTREMLAEQIDRDERAARARGGFGFLTPAHERIERDPEVMAARQEVECLGAAVSKAQTEVGGIVFLPAVDNLPKIEKKLAALNRKAGKIGTSAISLQVTEEKLVLSYLTSDEDTRAGDFQHVFAILSGTTPQIPGYEFLATVVPTEHGNIVKRIPAIRYGVRHNLDDRGDSPAAKALDAIDLSRFHHTGDTCEHCNKIRSRKDLYVVYNEKTGEALQVGRTCLRDYMGTNNPESVLKALEQVQEFFRSMHERSEQEIYPTVTFLTHAAAVMRAEGGYERGLGQRALTNIYHTERQNRDTRTGHPLWITTTPADEQRAQELLRWVRTEWTEEGPYPTSVKIALAGTHVPREFNLAASAYVALKRWEAGAEQRERQAAQKAADKPVIEGRIEITGEVVSTRWQENHYSYDGDNVKKMLIRDDRGFKAWGTVPSAILDADKGDRVSFTATVTKSQDDECFGFYSRPSKADFIDNNNNDKETDA